MKYNFIILITTIILLCLSCTKKIVKPIEVSPKYVSSQEFQIETEPGILINGVLEYADQNKLVIFIAGSGPTDKDCNNSAGLKTDAFKMLASHLFDQGISSFRFDKRSIGGSTVVPESDVSFDDFVSDVDLLVNHFATDFKEIVLLGHSEGALIGTIVSHQNKHIQSLIAVSGTSISLDRIVMEQLAKYPKLVPLAEKHIAEVMNDEPLSEVNPLLKSLFRPSVAPYLKSVFSVDPAAEISKVSLPVLIIGGICDIQVPTNHADKLHESCSGSSLVIIENMGHVMKELTEDCGNAQKAYNDPQLPLNKSFTDAISDFLKNQ